MKKGFTLLELMMVVIIIGILATIGIPQFTKAIDKTKGEEAKAVLGLIKTAQKMYRLDNNSYARQSDFDKLYEYMERPSETNFTYTITASDTNTFTARATETKSSARYITINEKGEFGGNYPGIIQPQPAPEVPPTDGEGFGPVQP